MVENWDQDYSTMPAVPLTEAKVRALVEQVPAPTADHTGIVCNQVCGPDWAPECALHGCVRFR